MMNADAIAGERVHILMRRQSMSQSDMAAHLLIDQSSMSKKLYGKRTWTLDELLTAARVLDVPVTELLPGDDYAPVPTGRGRMVGATRARRDSNPQPSDLESARKRRTAARRRRNRDSVRGGMRCQPALDAEPRDFQAAA